MLTLGQPISFDVTVVGGIDFEVEVIWKYEKLFMRITQTFLIRQASTTLYHTSLHKHLIVLLLFHRIGSF